MRKSRFTETQIVKILQEGEAGMPVLDLCRKPGEKKEIAKYMVKEHRLSIRRACSAMQMARSLFYYEHQREKGSRII